MTTAIAIVALVVSVIALVFSAYQWRHSGPDLVVRGRVDVDDLGREMVEAEIISTGRLAMTVTEVLVDYRKDDGLHLRSNEVELESKLPARLEPSDVIRVSYSLESIGRLIGVDTRLAVRAGGRWYYSQPFKVERRDQRAGEPRRPGLEEDAVDPSAAHDPIVQPQPHETRNEP
jgi:hypothetical protein